MRLLRTNKNNYAFQLGQQKYSGMIQRNVNWAFNQYPEATEHNIEKKKLLHGIAPCRKQNIIRKDQCY